MKSLQLTVTALLSLAALGSAMAGESPRRLEVFDVLFFR